MKKIKILFMGTPEFSVPILEALVQNYEVIGVVTQPDKPVGRKQVLTPSSVKMASAQYNLPIFQPVSLRKEYQEILSLQPDMIVTCAYGQFLPKEVLDFPQYGCINVHASLLPAYRGGSPIHKAIIDGSSKTGISIMYMNEKMDQGDILAQQEVIIEMNDTKGTLSTKLSHIGAKLLIETLPKIIDGSIKPQKQKEENATFAYNITREEEKLDFHKSTLALYNQIRGMNPDPIAYTTLDGKILKVYQARIGNKIFVNHEDGAIVSIYKDGIGVSTNDGEIILEEIQLEGKKRCLVKDFLNGVSKEELLKKVLK